MKLSLNPAFLVGLIGVLSSNICLGQIVQRTIIKSIDLQYVNEVVIPTGQTVTLEQWDRSYTRIYIDVKTIGVNKQTFLQWLKQNRYQCVQDTSEGILVLEMPNLLQPLPDSIQEEIHIRVLIPQTDQVSTDSKQVYTFIQ